MNIRVDLNYPIKDGTELVFRSPVDCSQVTGLKVYYTEDDGIVTSKEFAFADAHGQNVGDIDHLFAKNAVVKVILDVTTGMAFVQNADTNAYIERTFVKTVNGVTPDKNGNVEVSGGSGGGGVDNDALERHIANKANPHNVTASQIGAPTKSEMTAAINAALSGGGGGGVDNDALEKHIADKDNPHLVTAVQIGAVPVEEINLYIEDALKTQNLMNHADNTDNPHQVTVEQIGAVDKESAYPPMMTDGTPYLTYEQYEGEPLTKYYELEMLSLQNVLMAKVGDGDPVPYVNLLGAPTIGDMKDAITTALAGGGGGGSDSGLSDHIADTGNPHQVTAAQIGAATAAELANTKTIFNNKVIDTAYAYRYGMYEEFLTGTHYPVESLLMEKYLGGTFKVVWTAVHYTYYTTSEATEFCIPVPFKVKSHNITIDNYSDYCHTLEVIPGDQAGIDAQSGIYAFWVGIGAEAPEEGAESNLLDFTITITGTWE